MSMLINELRERWRAEGRRVFAVPGAVGVEFSDGCDVWWVGEGVELSRSLAGDGSAAGLADEFARLDRRRARFITVLRRHLIHRKLFVKRSRSGEWGLMTEGGVSSSVQVGARLTRLLVERGDTIDEVHAVLTELLAGTIVRKVPSVKLLERFLGETGEPADLAWPTEAPRIVLPDSPMAVLGMMGLCRALEVAVDDEAKLAPKEKLRAAAEPKGRIGQALVRMAERLPNAHASMELTDGSMSIEFSDRLDDFRVRPKSRELAEEIRRDGPVATGDRLADKYERLDAGRKLVLDALRAEMAARGYVIDDDARTPWHFGREFREVRFDAGKRLTARLRRDHASLAVGAMLRGHGELADAVARRVESGDVTGAAALTKRSLAPRPTAAPELAPVDEVDVAAIDAHCRDVLRQYITSDDALRSWFDADRFERGVDTWASDADWRRVAAAQVKGEWPNPMALWVLAELGDEDAARRLRGYVRDMEPHHEVADAEVMAAWRWRREMPGAAEKWFAPQPHDDVPYAEVRARLGDPIAVRRELAKLLEREGEDEEHEVDFDGITKLHAPTLRAFVGEGVIERWREEASRRVAAAWQWEFGGESAALRAAAVLGWDEVADALGANPYVLPAVLGEGVEMPAYVLGSDLLLVWSRLQPSATLERLLATLLTMDLSGELRAKIEPEAARVYGNVQQQRQYADMVKQVAESWLGTTRQALAIAWTRCRDSGAAQ